MAHRPELWVSNQTGDPCHPLPHEQLGALRTEHARAVAPGACCAPNGESGRSRSSFGLIDQLPSAPILALDLKAPRQRVSRVSISTPRRIFSKSASSSSELLARALLDRFVSSLLFASSRGILRASASRPRSVAFVSIRGQECLCRPQENRARNKKAVWHCEKVSRARPMKVGRAWGRRDSQCS